MEPASKKGTGSQLVRIWPVQVLALGVSLHKGLPHETLEGLKIKGSWEDHSAIKACPKAHRNQQKDSA